MRDPKRRNEKESRLNDRITVDQVRLVDETGALAGVVPTAQALARARDVGLDLVEVAPDAKPPVCKILDYGKLRFEERKKKALARKKQKVVDTKELQFRLQIEDHDYQVKLRNAVRFLKDGHKVRIVLRFKGRELGSPEIGRRLADRIIQDVSEISKPEVAPQMEGRRMIAILAPLAEASQKQKKAESAPKEQAPATAE